MANRVTYVASAAKALRKLDRQTARRILEALNVLADELVVLILRVGHRREVYR